MTNYDPRFEARPNQLGDDWCVYITWSSGDKETITGFSNQYQALNWIQHHSANWVVDKIMRDPTVR